jgi:hypothetical protein
MTVRTGTIRKAKRTATIASATAACGPLKRAGVRKPPMNADVRR